MHSLKTWLRCKESCDEFCVENVMYDNCPRWRFRHSGAKCIILHDLPRYMHLAFAFALLIMCNALQRHARCCNREKDGRGGG